MVFRKPNPITVVARAALGGLDKPQRCVKANRFGVRNLQMFSRTNLTNIDLQGLGLVAEI